jgi:hypothetical protein
MALIGENNVLYIADRIAKRFYFLYMAAMSGSPDGVGTYNDFWSASHVCPNGDPDIEIPTLTLASASDTAWSPTNFATVATNLISGITSSTTIIGGLTTHFSNMGLTGGWNQFLNTSANVTNPTNPSTNTGVRVSDYFRQVFARAGGGTLFARNVFYDRPNPFVFGTANYNGAIIQYYVGGNFGDGSTTRIADGTNFAAAQIQVMPVGGPIGGTTLVVDIVCRKDDGTTETISSFNIPANSPQNVAIPVGLVTNRYVAVTGVNYVSGGTSGDRFEVQNVIERAVAL